MNLPSPQPAMTKPKERLWENQTRTKERQKHGVCRAEEGKGKKLTKIVPGEGRHWTY